MAALTKFRPSSVRPVTRAKRPVAANAKGFKGGLAIAILSGASKGFYKQADGTSVGAVVGRFYEDFDNTAGADGALTADIHFFKERQIFLVNNDAGTPVAAANRESVCYALDDQTVTMAANSQPAGLVYEVDSEGVWVDINPTALETQLAGLSNVTELMFDKQAADGAAANATAEHVIYVASGREQILNIKIMPDAALVADNANFATIVIKKRDGLGGAPVTVATIQTTIAAGTGNWSAFQAIDFGVLVGGQLAAGSLLTVTITKSGTGVVVPASKLYAIAQLA